MTALDALTARQAIADLVAAYAHAADGGRFEALVALFTPDGTLQVDDRPALVGREAIHAFLTGTGAALQAATRQPSIRHHVSNLLVDDLKPATAAGRSYFLVVTERGVDHWGRYRDRWVRSEGVWRFAERGVRVDGTAPGSFAAERRGTGRTP